MSLIHCTASPCYVCYYSRADFYLCVASQKQLGESLARQHLRKEDISSSIHKDKDKMNIIKVHLSKSPNTQQHSDGNKINMSSFVISGVYRCVGRLIFKNGYSLKVI